MKRKILATRGIETFSRYKIKKLFYNDNDEMFSSDILQGRIIYIFERRISASSRQVWNVCEN